MISFRDRRAKEVGMELIVHINQDGVKDGVGPFSHGSAVHTDIMKTQGLKQALDKYKKKSHARKSVSSHSVRSSIAGTRKTSVLKFGTYIIRAFTRVKACVFSRSQTGLNLIFGSIFTAKKFKFPIFISQQSVQSSNAMVC